MNRCSLPKREGCLGARVSSMRSWPRRFAESCRKQANADCAFLRRRRLHWRQNIEMSAGDSKRERAAVATGEELATLLHEHASDILLALLDNPALDETQLCLLLDRKDLPAEVLEEVASRKPLLKNYRVKRGLAFHPRTPRLVSM